MKKTLFIATMALVSVVLWENNFAVPKSKMVSVSTNNFLNDTIPTKHKHKNDTTSTPTDTAGVTFVKGNRILSAK
jgi:hypothetical protein